MPDMINTAVRPLLISMEIHDIVLQINIQEDVVIQGDISWGNISQRISKVPFFSFQRLVLLPDPQCHFRYLTLQDRKFTLLKLFYI